jgi:hypothetical protein
MTDAAEEEQDVKAEVGELGDTFEGASPNSGELQATLGQPEAALDEPVEAEPDTTTMEDVTLKDFTTRTGKSTFMADHKAAREEWKRLGEEVKPDHVRVPACAYELIDRLIQPTRSEDTVHSRPSCRPFGALVPRSNVDPTVLRSFIHKMDRNHDDLVEPTEVSDLSLRNSLGITEEQISNMFQRIFDRRPPCKKDVIGIGWSEVGEETRISKKWVTAVDVSVTRDDGESYLVAVEKDALLRWCASMHSQFSADYPGLEAPTDPDSFLASMLVVSNPSSGKLMQSEPKVQKMLMSQNDDLSNLLSQPHVFASTRTVSERQTWGYEAPPYRDAWLRIIRAIGLKPFPKLESCAVGKTPGPSVNAVKATKKCHVGKAGQVQVRDPKPKVLQRSADSGQTIEDKGSMQMPVHSWDEKRHHSEGLVNTCISGPPPGSTERDVLAAAGFGDDFAASGSASSGRSLSVTFAARRKFQQVDAKHTRDSDEQRYIGQTKKALIRQASLLGQAGASVANVGITHGGPHSHLGFSQHHLTSSMPPSQLKYEPCLPHSWDGTHIDHSKETPLKEDVKYSKLKPEEREGQFSCYFTKKDNQCAKVDRLEGARHVTGKYDGWNQHEFRHDRAQRHGKYGRRVFDAQVHGLPMEHHISGIDNKPTEEFRRQENLVHEFLDRSLPPKQSKHFEHYLPTCQLPFRKENPIAHEHPGFRQDNM